MERLHKIVDGEKIYLTEDEEIAIRAEWAKNDLETQKSKYYHDRQLAYPSIYDQLDYLYHFGFDSWKELIKSIKDKYPKPT